MTAFHVTANACTGRGYSTTDANGFLKNFRDWVPRLPNDATIGNRGPGWYIIDDQSTLTATDPYIVISDQASPTPNSCARIMQVKVPISTGSQIQCLCWFSWNSSTHVGNGLWSMFNLPTVDSGIFAYDFRGGPDCMWLASFISGTLIFGMIESWTALSTYCEPATAISNLQNPFFIESGDAGNQLGGYENIIGINNIGANANVDTNGYLHFSLINTSGTTYRIDAFKDFARTIRVGTSATFTNTATGAKTFTADNTTVPGITGTITLTATATANTAISCRMGRVDVGSGDGTKFKASNEPYFMFDATGTVMVSYVRVGAIVGDTLVLSSYPTGKAFPTGALFGAYPHRFCSIFERDWNGTGGTVFLRFPYSAHAGVEYADQSAGTTNRMGDLIGENHLFYSQIDRYGNYWMQAGAVTEFADAAGTIFAGLRMFGLTNNVKMTNSANLAAYTYGRTLNGKNFLDMLHSTVGITGLLGRGYNGATMAFVMRDTPETA